FLDDEDVRLVGVEAAGAASLGSGRAGVLHGARSSILADADGQIADAHSISAGLDYPGVGPEHAYLRDIGRADYRGATDDEALAGGPVIRRAGERALARGMRTRECLELLARARRLVPETPLIPMTYSSLLEAYGWDRFAADVESAGATSMIVADLPAGERPEVRRVQLVAPTSTDERIAYAGEQTDGWLYLGALTGTTGARDDLSPALGGLVERARRLVAAPLYAGFGISTPEHARAAAELADGVVVGSRAVQMADEGPVALREYVASLRDALGTI